MGTIKHERQISFFKRGGHDHNGENSTKIDFTNYTAADVAPLADLIGSGGGGTTEIINNYYETTNVTNGSYYFALSAIPLGTVTASTAYQWTSVSGFQRGLIWRFNITSSASLNWSILVNGLPGGTGNVMFNAYGITDATFTYDAPWFYQNEVPTGAIYIGIQNDDTVDSTFTLNTLKAERFA